MDPISAALLLLWTGKSGIAPVDAAWKHCTAKSVVAAMRRSHYQYDDNDDDDDEDGYPPHRRLPPPPPPVVILEGPHNVGKTWMVLSLAVRFVVATRASLFNGGMMCDGGNHKNNVTAGVYGSRGGNLHRPEQAEEEITKETLPSQHQPIVLLLDSNYDFTISQLTHVLRSMLLRQPMYRTNNGGSGTNDGKQPDNEPLQKQEQKHPRRELLLERDIEDCLGRIHVAQVDDGPTGWVPLLEAIRHELGHRRRLHQDRQEPPPQQAEKSDHEMMSLPLSHHTAVWTAESCHIPASGPTNTGISSTQVNKNSDKRKLVDKTAPTLVLWDGFLSDIPPGDETSSREILQQVSRLLSDGSDSLWWVATTTTTAGTTIPRSSTTRLTTTSSSSRSNAAPSATKTGTAGVPYGSMTPKGVGQRVTEWIQKEQQEQERQRRKGQLQQPQHQSTVGSIYAPPTTTTDSLPRETCRVQLERPPGPTFSKSSAFATVLQTSTPTTRSNKSSSVGGGGNMASTKIPYSLSLQGILS
jgi:hypothetical protein